MKKKVEILVPNLLICLAVAQGISVPDKEKRQNPPGQNGEVIDNIFNIPITAIKQTAAATNMFSPETSQAIDSVFQIPISTLEAVGSLVKSTTAQRRQNADEIERQRQQRRDRIAAQKERQRVQREQTLNLRLRKQELKRIGRHRYNKDPLGLNALADLLVGNHGLFGGAHGGHGSHGPQGILGGLGSHGGHGGHGSHGHGGAHGGALSGQNTYEVYENVDEGGSFSWHGITAGIGNFVSTRPPQPSYVPNKIAPNTLRPEKFDETNGDRRIQNKVAPKGYTKNKFRYQEDPPLQNKIAGRNDRISFQR